MNSIADLFDRYLDIFHWTRRRAANQAQFHRCRVCGSIVTWRSILMKGGCKCGSARISPTAPLLTEKLRLVLLPWTI